MELTRTCTSSSPAVGEEGGGQLDDLRVDGRSGIADDLHVELPELPIAAGLRPVVAEHRSRERQLHRLGPGAHAVLHVGAHDAGGGLRAERPSLALLFAAPGLHAEELLLHHVRDLAHATLVDRRLLEERRLDGLVAIARGQVAGGLLEALEGAALGGQEVSRAAWGLEFGHRP